MSNRARHDRREFILQQGASKHKGKESSRHIFQVYNYVICAMFQIEQGYIETLVRQAYVEWNSLEEVAGFPSDSTHLLTQGILYSEFSY